MSESLLDELGVQEEEFVWQHLALCKNANTELFYDKYEHNVETARSVDEMCAVCPVMAYCFRQGMQGKDEGVWGGVYWKDGKPDTNKNQHKTPEVWNKIRSRLGNE